MVSTTPTTSAPDAAESARCISTVLLSGTMCYLLARDSCFCCVTRSQMGRLRSAQQADDGPGVRRRLAGDRVVVNVEPLGRHDPDLVGVGVAFHQRLDRDAPPCAEFAR